MAAVLLLLLLAAMMSVVTNNNEIVATVKIIYCSGVCVGLFNSNANKCAAAR